MSGEHVIPLMHYIAERFRRKGVGSGDAMWYASRIVAVLMRRKRS